VVAKLAKKKKVGTPDWKARNCLSASQASTKNLGEERFGGEKNYFGGREDDMQRSVRRRGIRDIKKKKYDLYQRPSFFLLK